MSTSNYPDQVNTSNYPNQVPAWRIFRYLLVQLVMGALRLGWWLLSRSILFLVGILRVVASPAVSGRSPDEFKDLVRADGGEAHADGSDVFWRMYLQAYSPRLWRMRRLMPMSAGKGPAKDDRPGEE